MKFDGEQYDISAPEMLRVMKGLVARDLWDMNEYYMVVNREDHAIDKALSILNDPALYDRFLGYPREVQ